MTQAKIGRGVQITFLGHSAFKLTGAGVNVLIDPWLTNPLLNTPVDKVGPVDLILVTHGHGDHVGETVAVAQANRRPGGGHPRAQRHPGPAGGPPGHRHEQGRDPECGRVQGHHDPGGALLGGG